MHFITAVDWFFTALYIVLLVRILLSWFPNVRGRWVYYIFHFTEPVLAPIRKIIQRSPLGGSGMVIDFSPIFAFLLIFLLRDVIISLLGRLL
ncbi:MAG: YggT family protein [Defluviitaleaceae bacterium]|nr:YggT family protein [Defluviitaleaceae bacterium]MCL2273801.1 YggT family protein [Defluviitaleaceae bacterium]